MSMMKEWPLDCKVYVGDLGNNATEHELESSFSKYGPLRNVWVARKPPGFAFIEFEDTRDAEDAVRAMDGARCCGVRIRAEMSSGRSRRGGRRGGGMGGGGGMPQRSERYYPRSRSRSPRRHRRSPSRSHSRSRERSPPPRAQRRQSRERSAEGNCKVVKNATSDRDRSRSASPTRN
ncbi:PREDICTED: RNA-binding protein 1-like isoform X2 [Priapulus caudatus]|uniref:RNA-binding protein 1-like isoform X2 n=1 Tax=Priapulus caudatus TaxID=37621 RepID=A0ABM1EUQ9_PRICU|nr:PREDICTED: RNA-binding protein 1-like isoform X2 [Priapulus caudatus]